MNAKGERPEEQPSERRDYARGSVGCSYLFFLMIALVVGAVAVGQLQDWRAERALANAVEVAVADRAELLVGLPEPTEVNGLRPRLVESCGRECDRELADARDGQYKLTFRTDLVEAEDAVRARLRDLGFEFACQGREKTMEWFERGRDRNPVLLSVLPEEVSVWVVTTVAGAREVGSSDYTNWAASMSEC